jgi:hypothetical protein
MPASGIGRPGIMDISRALQEPVRLNRPVARFESLLSQAWESLKDFKAPRRVELSVDTGAVEFLALGRRSNSTQLDRRQDEGLFSLVRGNDILEEVLDTPFALSQVKDVRAAMQLAGDLREALVRETLFFPVFAAVTLGFSIGLATARREQHGPSVLGPEQQSQCREWGVMVALYYLAHVEAEGIIDKDTDQQIYGIEDHWRLLADARRVNSLPELADTVRAGFVSGGAWAREQAVDMGSLLVSELERVVGAHPGRVFQ